MFMFNFSPYKNYDFRISTNGKNGNSASALKRCQRCWSYDHWTYECTGEVKQVQRKTRTDQLKELDRKRPKSASSTPSPRRKENNYNNTT